MNVSLNQQDNSRPPFLPPDMQEKALRSDPYPRETRFRGPAASPQAFHLPRIEQRLARAVPDPSPRAIAASSPAGGFCYRVSAPGQKEPRRCGVG